MLYDKSVLGTLPTNLFATNFEVDCINVDKLWDMPGEFHLYKVEDTGDVGRLGRLLAPSTLYLKMLLRNMEPQVVNGISGKVVHLGLDKVDICLEDRGETSCLHPVRLLHRENGSCKTTDPF